MLLIILQRLENGTVLTVDRDQPAAAFGNSAHEEFAGRDEAFLVGKGDIGAAAGSRQCRREAGRADDRRHHPVRWHGGGLDQGIPAGANSDAGANKRVLQLLIAILIGRDGKSRAAGFGLLRQKVDIVVAGDGGDVESFASAQLRNDV